MEYSISGDEKADRMVDPDLNHIKPLILDLNYPLNTPSLLPVKVLVVDDDRDTAELLKFILEPNDLEVTIANTGEEGIEKARTENPDVMIVDLHMPDMDGLRVCQKVRKFSAMPILVLSAVNKKNIVIEALNCGADDFLIKPMNHEVLIASVNKLARRARAEHKAQQANGNSANHD